MKHQKHSPTSFDAATKIEASASTLRSDVYRMLVQREEYGATDEEIQNELHMNPSTQRPRRIELVEFGLVHNSGGTRPTHSGRQAAVWATIQRPPDIFMGRTDQMTLPF